MKFGTKAKNLSSMRKELKKRKGTRNGIQYIPEDGLQVRFLLEPEEWTRYTEAYSKSMRRFWPVPDGDDEKVGDASYSVRYAATALDLGNDKVIVVKLPVSLADLLSSRAEKRGSIMDIDVELYKTGEGFDTVYGFEPLDKTKRNLAKYKDDLPDTQEVLEAEYLSVWGDEDDDDDEEEPVKGHAKRRTKFDPDDDDDIELSDEEDEEEDEEEADEDLDSDDEEDEEEADEEDEEEVDEDDDDEGEYWTEDELADLTIAELRSIAKDSGISVIGLKKQAIIEALV